VKKMASIIRTWTQEEGIEIQEVEFDDDRHAFEIYVDGKNAITIHAATPIESRDMRADLDAGDDVRDWEDGNGVSVESYITRAGSD